MCAHGSYRRGCSEKEEGPSSNCCDQAGFGAEEIVRAEGSCLPAQKLVITKVSCSIVSLTCQPMFQLIPQPLWPLFFIFVVRAVHFPCLLCHTFLKFVLFCRFTMNYEDQLGGGCFCSWSIIRTCSYAYSACFKYSHAIYSINY